MTLSNWNLFLFPTYRYHLIKLRGEPPWPPSQLTREWISIFANITFRLLMLSLSILWILWHIYLESYADLGSVQAETRWDGKLIHQSTGNHTIFFRRKRYSPTFETVAHLCFFSSSLCVLQVIERYTLWKKLTVD